jgi:hypothetical protein
MGKWRRQMGRSWPASNQGWSSLSSAQPAVGSKSYPQCSRA